MAITLKAKGAPVNGSPSFGDFNPSYPAGLASNDLSVLTVVFRTNGLGNMFLNAPAGWTAGPYLRFDYDPWFIDIRTYYKIGSFSGPIGQMSFTTGTPATTACGAHINAYQCGGSETWDLAPRSTRGWGSLSGNWLDLYYSVAGTEAGSPPPLGTTGGDYVIATAAYGTYTLLSNPVINIGAGQTHVVDPLLDNYNLNIAPSTSVVELGARVTSTTWPQGIVRMLSYGSGLGNGIVVGLAQRLTVNQRTSSDVRTIVDTSTFGGRTDTDIGTATEATGTVRTGVAVPYSRRWRDGDTPTASDPLTDLNLNWRDPMKWMLGYTRPGFKAYCTDTSLWPVGWNSVPLNTEVYKRGGITHASNDSKVYVPEDGWYEGTITIGLQALAGHSNTSWDVSGLGKNGGNSYAIHYHPHFGGPLTRIMGANPFRVYLLAGDYIEAQVYVVSDLQTKNWHTAGTFHTNSLLEFWWASR